MSIALSQLPCIRMGEYLELSDEMYYDVLEKWLRLKDFPLLVKHTRMYHPEKRRHVYVQVFVSLKEFENSRAVMFLEKVCEGNAFMKDWVSTMEVDGEIIPVIYAHDSNFSLMQINYRNFKGCFSSKGLGSRDAYYQTLIDFGLVTAEEIVKIKSMTEAEKREIKTVTMI